MDCYIDKQKSETIKGVLILLIVLGHNHVLCPNTEAGGIMEFLYLFHIAGFFILPFFYKTNDSCSVRRLGNIVIRSWVPYLWICLCCWLVYSIYNGMFYFGWGHVWAVFQGTQTPLSEYFGFVFPWFLPTYCSFSILLCVARKYKGLMALFTLLSVYLWFLDWHSFYQIKNTVPLGLGLACFYFGFGSLCFIIRKVDKRHVSTYAGLVFFVLLTIAYWNHWFVGFLLKMLPVFFFLSLFYFLPFLQFKMIRVLGKHSLGIYLFHMFFVNITYRWFPVSFVWGIVELLISVLCPLLMILVIEKISWLRILLFPRNFQELKILFCNKK